MLSIILSKKVLERIIEVSVHYQSGGRAVKDTLESHMYSFNQLDFILSRYSSSLVLQGSKKLQGFITALPFERKEGKSFVRIEAICVNPVLANA